MVFQCVRIENRIFLTKQTVLLMSTLTRKSFLIALYADINRQIDDLKLITSKDRDGLDHKEIQESNLGDSLVLSAQEKSLKDLMEARRIFEEHVDVEQGTLLHPIEECVVCFSLFYLEGEINQHFFVWKPKISFPGFRVNGTLVQIIGADSRMYRNLLGKKPGAEVQNLKGEFLGRVKLVA